MHSPQTHASIKSGSRNVVASSPTSWLFILLLVTFVFFAVTYIGQRHAGDWLAGDAVNLTLASQMTFAEGTIEPSREVYRFGFAYPSLNVFLSHLTGLTVETLQTAIQPFLVLLLVPIALVAFSRLTFHKSATLLATLLLFLQPEFIFESVRSSHAKLTWLLALTMLYLLAQGFEAIHRGRSATFWILAFYLVTLGLITSNSFFASSYILGITLAFLGIQLLSRFPGSYKVAFSAEFRRLSYVTLSGMVLVFLFVFYIYPPALLQFVSFGSAVDRIGALVLGTEFVGPSPYAYVSRTWLNTGTYLTLTLINYIVLALSFIAWLRIVITIIWKHQRLPVGRILLWLLYTALAAILAISVALDFTGIFSQNLQVRLFPHLMVAAIPLAALMVVEILDRLRSRSGLLQNAGIALLVAGVVFFAAAGLIKATNEPLLSNKWLFYTQSERLAIDWADETLVDTAVWTGLDRRLAAYVDLYTDWKANNVETLPGLQTQENRHFLISDIIEAQAARVGTTLPDVRPHSLVYDDGDAKLYFRRPATPYQR